MDTERCAQRLSLLSKNRVCNALMQTTSADDIDWILLDTRAKLRGVAYDAYLQTQHWKLVRQRALSMAGHRCQVCYAGSLPLNVHHRTYDRLGHEDPFDLIVLCRQCHSLFHGNGRLRY
jgi:5-methylcytosine-specific restriction endonuclease McrA